MCAHMACKLVSTSHCTAGGLWERPKAVTRGRQYSKWDCLCLRHRLHSVHTAAAGICRSLGHMASALKYLLLKRSLVSSLLLSCGGRLTLLPEHL